MTAKYQAYSEYKDFRVEWLGAVPFSRLSFLQSLSRNLYTSNGSPIKDFGDDVVGSDLFMSAKYQAYSEYKDFRVEWLGAVPFSMLSFLQSFSRNLYTNNGSPIKDFGDDVVGSIL